MMIKKILLINVFLSLCIACQGILKTDLFDDVSLKSNHPLLISLTKYDILSPKQYHDYEHTKRKAQISTQLNNMKTIHSSNAYFSFEFEGKKYVVDLYLNKELLPKTFQTSTVLDNGQLFMHKPAPSEHNHCYYQGHVRGIEDSKVIASTCQGLRGCIILPNNFLIVEPLWPHVNSTDYVIYRPQHKKQSRKTCGNNGNADHIQHLMSHFQMHSDTWNVTHQRKKRQAAQERMFVELMMVADSLEAKKYSRPDLEARIKDLVNYVDGFYQMLGIRIVLSHIEVWRSDRTKLTTDPQQVLDAFLAYRRERLSSEPPSSPWVYADNIHLLYGGNFVGSTVGMASVSSMCGTRSGGVNEDHSRDVVYTAATVAHEMGHNFGMLHDTRDCSCPRNAECIMAPSSGFAQTRAWSSCSKSYLDQNLKMGLKNCLLNVPDPSRIYTGPQCGNEIVEEGEQCDCGEPEYCKSKCCDAKTCQLLEGAICDEGMCCENCQYKAAGTECRGTDNSQCELAEYCTGTSANCPGNLYKENGTPCLRGTAVCHEGVCLTHEMQCVNAWGPNANSGPDECYTGVNSHGNDNGNCGKNDRGQFISCTRKNAKCGKLMCQGGLRWPLIGRDRVVYTNRLSSGSRRILECRTIGSDPNATDTLDPGLVLSGTMCAPGKVCNEGVCETIPKLECSSKCNGNGVCNNLRHCHCNDGWAPPYCSQAGSGGSLDSGPASAIPRVVATTTRKLITRRIITTTKKTTTTRRTTTTTKRTLIKPIPTKNNRVIPLTSTKNTPTTSAIGSAASVDPDTRSSNKSSVVIVVVIVLVVLLLIIAASLFAWCRFFGGKSKIEAWKKNREKRRMLSKKEFQPLDVEERHSKPPTTTASSIINDKPAVSISRENLLNDFGSASHLNYDQGYSNFTSRESNYIYNAPPELTRNKVAPKQPQASPPKPFVKPPAKPNSIPPSKPQPVVKPLTPAKPQPAPPNFGSTITPKKPSPPFKPPTEARFTPPVLPSSKPLPPSTKPAAKSSFPVQPTSTAAASGVVRPAPMAPKFKSSNLPPTLPMKPQVKFKPALPSSKPQDPASMSVMERARQFNVS